jgi:hypothetical protein
MSERIFVNSNLAVNLLCSSCNHSTQKDVSKFIKHRADVKLKYRCKCKKINSVTIDRRRSRRKEVHLKGFIVICQKRYPILIKNISKHGVGIILSRDISLRLDTIIRIEFTLNDPKESIISREVRIKNILPFRNVGCEFLHTDHYGDLGKYFLFYF